MQDMNVASFPTGQNPSTQFRVFATSTHVERRLNGIAPMAYALTIVGGPRPLTHWGWGGEKSTEAMLAHGLDRAVGDIFSECEEPTIEVITPAVGIDRYLKVFVPKWMRLLQQNPNALSNKDNGPVWKDLHLMALLANFTVRAPENSEERARCESLHRLAEAKANDAYHAFQENRARFETPGVYVADADEEAGGV
jgi:hypothetical protein